MKIAIIGGKGQMGKMFAEAFKKKGCEVILTGRRGNNIDAAKKADIIIVSVPIRETVKVIEEIASHIKEDALLTDFTSIKVKPWWIVFIDSLLFLATKCNSGFVRHPAKADEWRQTGIERRLIGRQSVPARVAGKGKLTASSRLCWQFPGIWSE